MLPQIRITIAEFFVFVDFDLHHAELDSPHGGIFDGWGLFVRKQLEGGSLFEGALNQMRGA